jgi:hypothetical protein
MGVTRKSAYHYPRWRLKLAELLIKTNSFAEGSIGVQDFGFIIACRLKSMKTSF